MFMPNQNLYRTRVIGAVAVKVSDNIVSQLDKQSNWRAGISDALVQMIKNPESGLDWGNFPPQLLLSKLLQFLNIFR